jgi:hypothetical protein
MLKTGICRSWISLVVVVVVVMAVLVVGEWAGRNTSQKTKFFKKVISGF